jgi:hypothetical protein
MLNEEQNVSLVNIAEITGASMIVLNKMNEFVRMQVYFYLRTVYFKVCDHESGVDRCEIRL